MSKLSYSTESPAGRADEAPTSARHLERAWVLNLIVVIVGEFILLKRIRLTGDNALSEPLLRSDQKDPKDLF